MNLMSQFGCLLWSKYFFLSVFLLLIYQFQSCSHRHILQSFTLRRKRQANRQVIHHTGGVTVSIWLSPPCHCSVYRSLGLTGLVNNLSFLKRNSLLVQFYMWSLHPAWVLLVGKVSHSCRNLLRSIKLIDFPRHDHSLCDTIVTRHTIIPLRTRVYYLRYTFADVSQAPRFFIEGIYA